MAEHCAVIGIGQTKHRESRRDLSISGLVRDAALRALQDADMTWKDIDSIVIGTAPDMFEGVMMPELWLSDALGAAGKPIFRVHTAGSVGGSTAVVASHLVQGGVHEKVLTLAFEKQSEANAMWALSPTIPFQPQLVAGAGGYFAPATTIRPCATWCRRMPRRLPRCDSTPPQRCATSVIGHWPVTPRIASRAPRRWPTNWSAWFCPAIQLVHRRS